MQWIYFSCSQGLWQRGQFVHSFQYISKRYANASWNLKVTLNLFHTTNPQLNLQSGSNQRVFQSQCKAIPTRLWITKQHRFGVTPAPALLWAQPAGSCPASVPTICICYYTSSNTLHSPTSDTGITGSTLGWPKGSQSKHWKSHARAKQSLQMHLPPQRCLDSITHILSLSTAMTVLRGGLYVPKCTNELFGLPAEFFISRISFWEFFKMILWYFTSLLFLVSCST